MTQSTWPVYILSGGQSRRFGSDKARAVIDGTPLILRVANQVRKFASEITIVAGREQKYADLGLHTIVDRLPHRGPVAGLDAALANANQRWGPCHVLLVSCDMIMIQPEWITTLASRITANTLASLFRDDRWHPFPGLYHTDFSQCVDQILQQDVASFQKLFLTAAAHVAGQQLPSNWPAIVQVNTVEELKSATDGLNGNETTT